MMCESKMISKNNDEVDVGCGNAFGGEGAEEAGEFLRMFRRATMFEAELRVHLNISLCIEPECQMFLFPEIFCTLNVHFSSSHLHIFLSFFCIHSIL